MLNFCVNNDVLNELYYDKDNIILPWGIETADSTSFFSLEKGVGYRYNERYSEIKLERNDYIYKKTIEMHDGIWNLEGHDYIENGRIRRKVKVTCLEDSYFLDFVMRFRFKKEFFDEAIIGGKRIEHNNTNVYYQFPVKQAILRGDYDVDVSVIDCEIPTNMKAHMYVRDFEDEWVIHARMIPTEDEKKVIKLCNRWYKTKPLPDFFNNLLCNNQKIYEYLKYRNEKEPYQSIILKHICPNAFPMIRVKKGKTLMWDIEVKITDGK